MLHYNTQESWQCDSKHLISFTCAAKRYYLLWQGSMKSAVRYINIVWKSVLVQTHSVVLKYHCQKTMEMHRNTFVCVFMW